MVIFPFFHIHRPPQPGKTLIQKKRKNHDNRPQKSRTARRLIINALQIHSKSLPFAMRKLSFCTALAKLLEDKSSSIEKPSLNFHYKTTTKRHHDSHRKDTAHKAIFQKRNPFYFAIQAIWCIFAQLSTLL